MPTDRPIACVRMPALFVGHGSPLNSIADNRWSRAFVDLGTRVPPPRTILAVSAHWYIPAIQVTGDLHPRTIHDFSGFPPSLYEIEYRAPGDVNLAHRIRGLIGENQASLSTDWGFDHGTWSVLRWMYPRANIPVVQLSIDRRLSPQQHYDIARTLSELRDDGVLILGSGNIVHNLRDAFGRMQSGSTETPPWAERFDRDVKTALQQRDTAKLLAMAATDDGRSAHPTPDHWLPLIYAYGVTDSRDTAWFTSEAFDLGSLSMRNVGFG